MNDMIEEGIKRTVSEAIDKALFAIQYNLSNVFGGLLYSVKLEDEKIGGVGDIDKLIRIVVHTSKYDGPEGEEYPVWDEKQAKDIRDRLVKILQAHGIKQSWNIFG